MTAVHVVCSVLLYTGIAVAVAGGLRVVTVRWWVNR